MEDDGRAAEGKSNGWLGFLFGTILIDGRSGAKKRLYFDKGS